MAFQTVSNGAITNNMISLVEHQALMDQQRVHFEGIISNLQQQLKYNADPSERMVGNINRRTSSVLLDSLVGPHQMVEDFVEDPFAADTESEFAKHQRGATSQILDELLHYESKDSQHTSDTDSSSDDPQHNNGYDAILLEQQIISDTLNVDGMNVDGLKEIIETLKAELANSRMSEYRHNTQRHHEQRLKSISVNRRVEGFREILQSKMDLVESLSDEFERMRNIIKRQQMCIDMYLHHQKAT